MDTLIILVGALALVVLGFLIGALVKDQEWKERLPQLREESVKRSRSVLTGQFSEQLAPYLPGFPFSPTECRFLGKPVDLIVFKGLDGGSPEEVVFVEMKTGKAQLSPVERRLRDVILEKKVAWAEYRPDAKPPSTDGR